MKILTLRPAPPGGSTIAHVDVEIIDGVKLYGLRVSRAKDGSFRVFGLSNYHGRTSAFDRSAVEAIAKATIQFMTMNGLLRNDDRSAA